MSVRKRGRGKFRWRHRRKPGSERARLAAGWPLPWLTAMVGSWLAVVAWSVPILADEDAQPAASRSKAEHRCDYDPVPVLSISTTFVLLEGVSVNETNVLAFLRDKQALRALLGAKPRHEIIVRVERGVPEERVERFLARARRAGFVNVTRFSAEARRP